MSLPHVETYDFWENLLLWSPRVPRYRDPLYFLVLSKIRMVFWDKLDALNTFRTSMSLPHIETYDFWKCLLRLLENSLVWSPRVPGYRDPLYFSVLSKIRMVFWDKLDALNTFRTSMTLPHVETYDFWKRLLRLLENSLVWSPRVPGYRDPLY